MADDAEWDDESRPCTVGATCASGGRQHCRMYDRYPEALDDAGDGCCVKGCYLDAKDDNVK